MKDFLGHPLAIGDAVVFIAPGYRSMVLGLVVAFTAKKVRLEYVNDWNYAKPGLKLQLLQDSDQLARVDPAIDI